MSDQEGQGFVIRDRRGRGPEEAHEAGPAKEPAGAAARPASGGPSGGAPHGHEPAPPISFASFVFSLGTSALMLMGEKVDPNQPEVPVNLGQAKEIVDILSILEEKTRGNLNEDEQVVLRDMLYALRLKYVDRVSEKPARPSS